MYTLRHRRMEKKKKKKQNYCEICCRERWGERGSTKCNVTLFNSTIEKENIHYEWQNLSVFSLSVCVQMLVLPMIEANGIAIIFNNTFYFSSVHFLQLRLLDAFFSFARPLSVDKIHNVSSVLRCLALHIDTCLTYSFFGRLLISLVTLRSLRFYKERI